MSFFYFLIFQNYLFQDLRNQISILFFFLMQLILMNVSQNHRYKRKSKVLNFIHLYIRKKKGVFYFLFRKFYLFIYFLI